MIVKVRQELGCLPCQVDFAELIPSRSSTTCTPQLVIEPNRVQCLRGPTEDEFHNGGSKVQLTGKTAK